MRRGIFLSRHRINRDFPYLDVAHGRVRIDKLPAAVVSHDGVQCSAFFFHVFDELHPSPANHALCPHTVTARHAGMLKHQFVVYAKRDADMVVSLQHVDTAARGAGVQINNSVAVTEVHRNNIRIAFEVCDAYKTNVAAGNDFFHPFFIFDNDCFHIFLLSFLNVCAKKKISGVKRKRVSKNNLIPPAKLCGLFRLRYYKAIKCITAFFLQLNESLSFFPCRIRFGSNN